jgi:Tfp pilus assembly protein PilO
MSGRDRVIAMVIAVLVVIAAGWMLLVSPERQKASKLSGEVSTAQSEVSTAEGELSSAQAAKDKYAAAYAAVVHLGKAVPPAQEVASLMYQMAGVTTNKHVDFESIISGGGASAATATTAAATAAGFTAMPFTFGFKGDYFDLEHLFGGLTGFASHEVSGGLQIDGRLLTIQSVTLSGSATPASQSSGDKKTSGQLEGKVTASAYVLPSDVGLTAGATPEAPAAATPAASPSPTTTGTPAVSKVLP